MEKVVLKYVSNYLDVFYNETDKKVTNDPDVVQFYNRLVELFGRRMM
jgi:hypothetical protein